MIISTEKFREIVVTDESDEILNRRLSALENLIRSYSHNNFQIREIRSHSEVLGEIILNPPVHISVGDTVQISESVFNNGLYIVESLLDGKMSVSGKLIDCKENIVTKVLYPPDVVMGTVNMLKWELENREKVGVQSETISRHSVTYFNMDGDNAVMGYPKSLMGFLKPYMKGRF